MVVELKNIDVLPEGLRGLIQNQSFQNFKLQTMNEDLELMPKGNKEKPIVYAHWMSLIMLANSNLKLIFKAHYNYEDVVNIGKECFERSPSHEAVHDFMREFCNLIGGMIKAALEEQKIQAGLSLPLVTRGFDEVFFSTNSGLQNMFDHFSIFTKDQKVSFSTQLEVLDAKVLKQLNNIKSISNSEEGEFEFL